MPIEPVTPPKGENATPSRAKRATPGSAKLREQVAELYTTVGMVVVTPIDRLAGTLLVHQADDIAEQWVKLAETNPTVKRVLQKLVEAGGWGGIIVAHGMIAMPVLANRGMFPEQVAAGAATMTMLQYPDTAALFTHPRFQREPGSPNGTGENWGDGSS